MIDPSAIWMVLGVLTGWPGRQEREASLDRIAPIGERHVQRAVAEYVEHYHRARNHQDRYLRESKQ
jgi:hypothetical protein